MPLLLEVVLRQLVAELAIFFMFLLVSALIVYRLGPLLSFECRQRALILGRYLLTAPERIILYREAAASLFWRPKLIRLLFILPLLRILHRPRLIEQNLVLHVPALLRGRDSNIHLFQVLIAPALQNRRKGTISIQLCVRCFLHLIDWCYLLKLPFLKVRTRIHLLYVHILLFILHLLRSVLLLKPLIQLLGNR